MLSRCLFYSKLREFCFAPRQLNRWVLSFAFMIRNFTKLKSLLLLCTFLCFASSASAQERSSNYQGKVLSVESGNFILLQIDKRKLSVTLFGVGAVEAEQPTGKQSRDNLSRLLKNKQITFLPNKQFDLIKEQTSAGKVLLDGRDVALQQLSEGLVHITKEGRNNLTDEDKKLYEQAEQAAFEKHLGLWSNNYKCKSDTTNDKTGGFAEIEVLIDESGNVVRAKALCGNPIFRSAAVKAALNSKFKPTILAGIAVKVTGTIKYNFEPQTK